MVRSLYLRNNKLKNATILQKTKSKMQRRINSLKEQVVVLTKKNKKRLDQARYDHDEIIKLEIKLKEAQSR